MNSKTAVKCTVYVASWLTLGYTLWKLIPPSRSKFLSELTNEERECVNAAKYSDKELKSLLNIIKENAESNRPIWQTDSSMASIRRNK